MRIMIMGHARSGKDTFAELLSRKTGLSFDSSSMFCARKFIYDSLKGILGYRTLDECYSDRMNHRSTWASLIKSYNWKDPAKLSREILSSYDMYVGIRSSREFIAAKEEGLFDLAIWVDASGRVEDEGTDSFDIDISLADIVVNNNGTEEEFVERTLNLTKAFSGMDSEHAGRLCHNGSSTCRHSIKGF